MASLNPFTGVLGKRLAAHLLRRATYKVTPAQIEAFALLTPAQALDKLFTYKPLKYPTGPLFTDGQPLFNLDNIATSKAVTDTTIAALNRGSVYSNAWRMNEAFQDDTAKWKVVHWFHTLFAIRHDGNALAYYYYRLLEKMAFSGDIRTLAKKVTVDNSMLLYLSNHYNRKGAPNENYAREFLELFTILKGEAIAVGNYTNYTEADISQTARVLTGFITNNTTVDPDTGIACGVPSLGSHDTGNKTFSAAFQGRIIKGATTAADMPRELSDYVNMVFDQDETARAYVRRMYQFFVNDNISATVETDIIRPLATDLKTNGYKHVVVLKKLLASQHFYDKDDSNATNNTIGCKIKSPYELLMHSVTIFNLEHRYPTDNDQIFRNDYYAYDNHLGTIGLSLAGPDTVEGYPGFYKAPNYSKNFFLSSYIYRRYSFSASLLRGAVFNTGGYFPYKLDIVKWVSNTIELPTGPGTPDAPIGASDAVRVVEYMFDYLLPERPTGARYEYFLNALLGGLSPVNWYFSWVAYKETAASSDVKAGLERLGKAIISSPEYQTF